MRVTHKVGWAEERSMASLVVREHMVGFEDAAQETDTSASFGRFPPSLGLIPWSNHFSALLLQFLRAHPERCEWQEGNDNCNC